MDLYQSEKTSKITEYSPKANTTMDTKPHSQSCPHISSTPSTSSLKDEVKLLSI